MCALAVVHAVIERTAIAWGLQPAPRTETAPVLQLATVPARHEHAVNATPAARNDARELAEPA